MADFLDFEMVRIGSAGAKAMAVVRGEVDAYLHAGGQWEWDSAAPAGVVLAAGMHASRLDGSPMLYNRPDPYLPDLLMCRPSWPTCCSTRSGRRAVRMLRATSWTTRNALPIELAPMESWSAPEIPELPGQGPQLRLYDSADRQVRPVSPGATATMYVCGITPYDATHLGHAATYLTFDLVNRLWRDGGHRVHYVQNVTDVDDPLFERADRDGIDWRALGDRETQLFRDDMTALRAAPAGLRGRHRRHRRGGRDGREDAGFRLGVRGRRPSTRTSISAPTPPGSSVRVRLRPGDHAHTVRRAWWRPDRSGKADPLDALVWRAVRPGEPSWPSPFGPGRPGWHVECSAIATDRLGMGFDIQGGGGDLIFPHHEFSAAHAESVTGERFARHYVHAGMIGWDGHKMSKSRGNLVLVSRLRAEGVDPGVIRLGLFAGHYRSDRYWSPEVLDEAQGATGPLAGRHGAARRSGHRRCDRAVRQYLADDLDTPKALAALDGWAEDALEYGGHDAAAPGQIRAAVDALLGIAL
jgi:L-cysteine:1D-myo-inositol 2-amino-2-deoxy-alpha-D-glucopyranoside ligase